MSGKAPKSTFTLKNLKVFFGSNENNVYIRHILSERNNMIVLQNKQF